MRTQILGSHTKPGLILVHRGLIPNVAALEQGLSGFARYAHLTLGNRQALKVSTSGTTKTVRGTYKATDRYGRQYTLRLGAVLSGKGTALVVLGGTTAKSFSSLKQSVDRVVASARVGTPNYHTRLVGTYVFWTGKSTTSTGDGGTMRSSDTFYTFDGRGNLRIKGNHMVAVDTGKTPLDGSNTDNGWSRGSASGINHTQGRASYKLLGKNLLIITKNGKSSVHHINIFSNGLKVDGKLYPKQ